MNDFVNSVINSVTASGDARFGLLMLIIKVSLICFIACVLSRLLRRQSSRLRHQILLVAFGVLLLIPVAQFSATGWSLKLPEQATNWLASPTNSESEGSSSSDLLSSNQPVTNSLTNANQNPASITEVIAPSTGLSESPEVESAIAPGEMAPPPSNLESEPTTSQAKPIPWLILGLTVWLVGTFLCLFRLAVGWFSIHRLLSKADFVDSATMQELLIDCCAELNCSKPVRLRTKQDQSIPLVTGIFSPVILLPSRSLDWSKAKVRSTILHELAHVVRRDCLSNWFANITASAYWWNPLVWVLKNELAAEREKASDELVVACSPDPTDYAEHLVSIVRESRLKVGPVPVAMARSNKLTERVKNILSYSVPSRRSLFLGHGILSIFSLFIIPLAFLHAVNSEPNLDNFQSDEPKISDKDDAQKTNEEIWLEKYEITKAELDFRAARSSGPVRTIYLSRKGKIVDESGDPISNAIVQLRLSAPFSYRQDGKDQMVVAQTTTNGKGEYGFANELSPPILSGTKLALFVSAPGFGYAWQFLDLQKPILEQPLEIVLPPEDSIEGIVVDSDSNPVSNAQISCHSVVAAKEFQDFRNRSQEVSIRFSKLDSMFKAKSDEQGRFRINGVSPKQVLGLRIQHESYLDEFKSVSNAKNPPPEEQYDWKTKSIKKVPLETGTVKISLERGRRVVGQVVYPDTNKPAVGLKGQVFVRDNRGQYRAFKTDDEGRFEAPWIREHELAIYFAAEKGTPYLNLYKVMKFASDDDPVREVKLVLEKGQRLTGSIKNTNGKPAVKANVHFVGPPYELTDSIDNSSYAQTDENGNFEIYVRPGMGVLHGAGLVPGFEFPSRMMVAMRKYRPNYEKYFDDKHLTIIDGQEHPPLDLVLQASMNLVSRLVDDDGNPLAGAKIELVDGEGMLSRDGYTKRKTHYTTTSNADGSFAINDIPHDCKAVFEFTHESSDRAAVRIINTDEDLEPTIQLAKRGVIRSVVFKDGKPAAGIGVRLLLETSRTQTSAISFRPEMYTYGKTVTNEQGEYEFRIPSGFKPTMYLNLEKGENHDVQCETPNPGQVVTVPAFKFQSLVGSIAGIVTDPDGNPLAGIDVAVYPVERGRRNEGPSHFAKANQQFEKTKADGRFEFRHLPSDTPVRVRADLAGKDRKRLVATSTEARTGEKTVTLILDPAVAQSQPRKR